MTDDRGTPNPLDGQKWWPPLLLPNNGPACRWWLLPDGRVAGVAPIFERKKCGAIYPIVGAQSAVSSPNGKGRRFGPRHTAGPNCEELSDRIGDAGDWLASYAAKKGWVPVGD